MSKQEFLIELRKGMSGLPQNDIEERLMFYSEMIDDRMEEGLLEEDAVSAIGNVNEIVSQIIADTPLAKIVKEKVKPKKRLKVWEIVLLVLGSPIWISLCATLFVVILSLYVVLWCVIVSLWAVWCALIGCALGAIVSGSVLAVCENGFVGTAMIGAGILCAGLSILVFFVCKAATKGTVCITKKVVIGIKKYFIKKESV